MKNNIVSIVVSIFNVKEYLNRCIESLIHQSYKDIQIILVDDGSSDGSSLVCDRWGKKDSRIEVVHKKNGGLSDARNCGLKKAKGAFVCFVDGDDYVESRMIELTYKVAKSNNADIVIFSNYVVYSNNQKEIHHLLSKKKKYTGSEEMKVLFDECIGSLPNSKTDYDVGFSPWGRLYKRSFLLENNIRFKNERILIYEDLMFLLDSLPVAHIAVVLDSPLYNYCLNENSLTHKADSSRFKRIKKQYYYLKNNSPYSYEIFNSKDTMFRFKRTMIGYVRNAVSQIVKNNNCAYSCIKNISSDYFCQELLKNYPIKKLPKKQFVFAFLLKYKLNMLLYIVEKLNAVKNN